VKRVFLSLALVAATFPAFAGGIGLSGAHYNLNIIGLDNPKDAKLVGSDRHTIFVDLTNKLDTHDNIYLAPGDTFQVCDGNATDTAYACDGTSLGKTGAVFQLPCNTNVTGATPCDASVPSSSYTVWVAAITKGGSATITTCATDETGMVVCDTTNSVTVSVRPKTGHPIFNNVTQSLTTLTACFDPIDGITGNIVCETVSLFDPVLTDYVWQYVNSGLRLAQLRFYAQ
jgi:hypothetical protein